MENKLKELVTQSYKNGLLDQESVQYIADRLNREDLKQYINLLKQEESKKDIFVTSAEKLSTEDLEKIKRIFPNKNIVTALDKSMISGVRIVENDQEYEVNLNRTFHDIIGFLSTND